MNADLLGRRHLTESERQTVATIFCEAGPVELLHLVGQLLAHHTNDLTKADEFRSSVSKVARNVAHYLDSPSDPQAWSEEQNRDPKGVTDR